ncbi:hypothetical protein [Tropicimonas isoalkanivorans]|uniref:Uncharacterized protein n=1 Tax=Tropicimonas isoalkanivorans TaxID=441112 RepID=A0A1I1JJ87_9RHOB|nr:hypothetical protein [Tropicimonas isoalkanivorans]SFC48405.1 hypothetical protein SAMN04488094_105144 [Tropicimonas isoalkanivorans]
MKRFALTTAIVLGLAAPALANEQLANNAGVEPGVYSTSELVQIIDAQRHGNWSRVHAVENRTAAAYDDNDRTSAGHLQLARSAGVSPSDYATSDVVKLRSARANGDYSTARFIETSSDDSVAGSTMSSKGARQSQGHVQLARSLGVNPADFTTNELALLRAAVEDNNQSRIDLILARAGS